MCKLISHGRGYPLNYSIEFHVQQANSAIWGVGGFKQRGGGGGEGRGGEGGGGGGGGSGGGIGGGRKHRKRAG